MFSFWTHCFNNISKYLTWKLFQSLISICWITSYILTSIDPTAIFFYKNHILRICSQILALFSLLLQIIRHIALKGPGHLLTIIAVPPMYRPCIALMMIPYGFADCGRVSHGFQEQVSIDGMAFHQLVLFLWQSTGFVKNTGRYC